VLLAQSRHDEAGKHQEEVPMNKQLITGLSVLALFAMADVAAAQKAGGVPGATTGASPGNAGGANMGAGKESPGASERSNPSSSSERGMSSEKDAASEHRSEKGADKELSKDKSNDRAQSSDKDKSTKGAAKDSDTSKSDRAAKENKDSSSGAASGESGKPGSTTAEGRSDTSGKAHVSLSQEQRSRVQSAFKSHLGSAKVDVKIEPRIGVVVPRNVTLFDIPEDVVIIVPEWRRYKYVLIGDEICIVDLDTYEIVEVVAAV
jgi:hypothetical protein